MVPVYVHSLSALMPVKLVYKFNKEEKISGTLSTFRNGFGYYKHDGLENFQDAVLSNKTCLILTDNIPLKTVFESDSKQINIGTIAGCLYLKTSLGHYIKTNSNGIFAGGIGTDLFINLIPQGNNVVEMKIGDNAYVHIEESYPFTANVSTETLAEGDLNRKRFEIEYRDNLVAFRTLTKEGWRYLSYGTDRAIRAVGLMLNETIINPYLFTPVFVSNSNIHYNFDARTSEIKYYNEITSYGNRDTVNIKQEQESPTSLLISIPTSEISKNNEVPVNIALTKTNFSSSGSYTTKRTL